MCMCWRFCDNNKYQPVTLIKLISLVLPICILSGAYEHCQFLWLSGINTEGGAPRDSPPPTGFSSPENCQVLY